MANKAAIVFQKEIRDSLRDRRTLFGAVFYPLLGPLMMMLLFGVIGRVTADQSERPLVLPVVGAQNAPNLVAFLRQAGVDIRPAPADPLGEVRAGNADVVLIIPANFGADFNAGRPAPVQLVLDNSRQSAGVSIGRTQRLLNGYSQQVGALRLLVRGVDPGAVSALAVENVDVATPQSQAALLLNILPYFMIFSVFIGGSGITIDGTAGERERGSLEPLVINPVARWQLVVGKLGVSLLFTLAAVGETLLGFALMLPYLPLQSLGFKISLDPAALAGIFLLTLPMMVLAISLQFIIGTFTRSYREAQNYLSLLPLVPALPGLFLAFVPIKPELWTMLIPTFGQQLLINQLMRGEAISPVNVAIVSSITLAAGLIVLLAATRLFAREGGLYSK
ncbi:MAG: ABC transporter permease [Anaerolineales bacterium]